MDASGGRVSCADYLPFGEEIQTGTAAAMRSGVGCFNGGAPLRQKFTGKERDGETGLDYFGARYLSGAAGRFTSLDPEGASASLFDPQRWNAYSYVVNNPLKFVDRDGEIPLLAATALIGSGVGAAGGAVFDLANQLIKNGGNFSAIDRREVFAAVLGGAVSGGIAGLTLGLIPAPATLTAGYVATAGIVNGGANVVGGVVQREVDPNASGSPTVDFVAGALGGAGGTKVAYVRYPLPNVKKELAIIANSNRRSLRPQRVSSFSQYAQSQAIQNTTASSVIGTALANFTSNLYSNVASFLSNSKSNVTSGLISDEKAREICRTQGGCVVP